MIPAPLYAPEDEKALIQAMAGGDRQAFSTLYSRYLGALFQYILLFTIEKDMAEEIVQDVFVRIWEKRASMVEVASFKAYLFRAAKNQLINYLKREQVRLRVTGEWEAAATAAVNPEDTQLQVDYRRVRDLLRRGIDGLPKRRREVFLLSTEEGLSLDEIAARLGISKNVVKKQLYEAYATVRDFLTEHGELSAYLILLLTLLQA